MAWNVTTIDDICEPTEQCDPRREPTTQFRYVDITGIDRVRKTIGEYKTILGAKAPSRARKVIRKDDLLVSTVRPNLNAVAMVPSHLDGHIASTGFCVLRPIRAIVEPRYLFYRTMTPGFVSELTALVRGANYPAVSDRDVKGVKLRLPTLSEQRRVVELLDNADRLCRLRAEADSKTDRILLALFIKMFGDPSQNRMGSVTKPFSEVLTQPPRNGLSPSSNGTFPAKVLTLSAVTGTTFDETAVKERHFVDQPPANKQVDPQDFLICRGNGNLGLLGRARFPHRRMENTVFPDTIIAAKVDQEQINAAYLEALWQTSWMRQQIESRSNTTSGIHKINQTALGSLPVRLPPIALQNRFGVRSHALRRDVVTRQTRQAEALDKLFNLLSHRAFADETAVP